MPSSAKRSRIPPVPNALLTLAKLTDADVRLVLTEFQKASVFDLSYGQAVKISEALTEVDPSEVVDLFDSLVYLYNRVHSRSDSESSIEDSVNDFLRSSGLSSILEDETDKVVNRLATLLESNPVLDTTLKRTWLRTGILDNALRFASFVDLRPNFSPDRKDITELLPVIILQLTTDSESRNRKSIVIQLSPDSLSQLRKTIEDIDKKLNTLKSWKVVSEHLTN